MMIESTWSACDGPHVAWYVGVILGIRCLKCNIPVRPDPRVTETATRFASPNLEATKAAVNARGVTCRRCGQWTMRPARVITPGNQPRPVETDDLCLACLATVISKSIDQFARLGRNSVGDTLRMKQSDMRPEPVNPRRVTDPGEARDLLGLTDGEPELCQGCGEPRSKGTHGLDTGFGGCV